MVVMITQYLLKNNKFVYSSGRAGSYLYGIDIDDCIRQSMIIANELKNGGQENTVPGKEYQFPELSF